MNISGINFESVVDGTGVRVVVFFSGCLHDCKGCHNPSSHSFTAGRVFSDEVQDEIIEYIRSTPFISGITLSGGDPMFSAKEVVAFIKVLREEISTTVWVYSGFTFEEIVADKDMLSLLQLCDVLVDGRFVLEKRDTTLAFRGSKNQRVVDVQKSLSAGRVIELDL